MLSSAIVDSSLKAERYASAHRSAWDDFIESSKNGTFILKRDYMEYHSDRFQDHSVMIFKEKKR